MTGKLKIRFNKKILVPSIKIDSDEGSSESESSINILDGDKE